MKILLCSVPDGTDKPSKPLIPRGQTSTLPIIPLGILRVLSSVQEHGYDGEIYDINNLRHSDEEIEAIVRLFISLTCIVTGALNEKSLLFVVFIQ